jgi:hypothetical protein
MFPFVFKVLIAPKTSGQFCCVLFASLVSVGRFRARLCSNEHFCWFLKKTSRIAMTIIEIRPFQNGWTVFEAPGVKKSLKFPELALAASVVAQ